MEELIKEMRQYAKLNDVPIFLDDTYQYIKNFIIQKNIKNILEIGTAIAYSSIMMCLVDENIHITTIERDKERYLEAVKNVKKAGLEDRITLIFNDALNVNIEGEFDLIFIDAAKGKNQDFFEKFIINLSENGYIITDNIAFHGYVKMNDDKIPSKNILKIVNRIRDYIYFLENNMLYKSDIYYEIGDGIAVTERR